MNLEQARHEPQARGLVEGVTASYEQHMVAIAAAYDADAQASLDLAEAQNRREATQRELRLAYRAFSGFLDSMFAERSTTDRDALMAAWQTSPDFKMPLLPWRQDTR